MQYVFNVWNEIYRRIKQAKTRLLLCDYDGTLTAIVDRPEMAKLADETKQLLVALAHKSGLVIGIISGRALVDIKGIAGVEGIVYAGNHGFEIEGPGVQFVHPLTEEIGSIIRVMGAILEKTAGKIRGVLVENKGMTLSVHYRLVDEEQLPKVNSMFENTVGTARKLGKIRTTSGKKVHEIRPAIDWHKGKAVELIVNRYSPAARKQQAIPIYLGDDLTDEDAFKVVNNLGGISILIGEASQASAADYYLSSTSEVKSFLAELLKIL